MPLAVQPVEEAIVLALLATGVGPEFAVRNIVHHRVAGHVFQCVGFLHALGGLADDKGQLAFPVDVIR